MMAATTSSSNRIITFPAVSTRITDVSNEPLDPLPDETVVKAGWLTKKGRRGNWKRRWFVLRADRLAYYKDEKEYKTLKVIQALDINAVTFTKSKRPNTFGIFTSSRTYTLSAPSKQDAEEWIEFLLQASQLSTYRCQEELGDISISPAPKILQHPPTDPPESLSRSPSNLPKLDTSVSPSGQRPPSSSAAIPFTGVSPSSPRPTSSDMHRVASFDSSGGYFSGPELSTSPQEIQQPATTSSAIPEDSRSFETDELEGLAGDRVVAQGYLLCLKNVSGVRQWKRRWVVLRGRSLTLYKNFEEYKPLRIIPLTNVLAAVDTDPLSRTKRHCFQVVTRDKILRFCADSEAEVDRWLGGLVSLLEGSKGVGQGIGGSKVDLP